MNHATQRNTLFLVLLSFFLFSTFAMATTAGPNSPGTASNDTGEGDQAWIDPENIYSSNNIRSRNLLYDGYLETNYLKATNFGFSIPTGSTINGIVVEFEKSRIGVSVVFDQQIKIVRNGVIGLINKSEAALWPTVDSYSSYGTSTDLWGETWTAEDINASTFGVVLKAAMDQCEARVDHIRITVYYTEGGPAAPFIKAHFGGGRIGPGRF